MIDGYRQAAEEDEEIYQAIEEAAYQAAIDAEQERLEEAARLAAYEAEQERLAEEAWWDRYWERRYDELREQRAREHHD